MKKILIITVVASLAIFMFSCSKDGSVVTGSASASGQNNVGSGSPTGGSGSQTKASFVSEWSGVEFKIADNPSIDGLFGEIAISPFAPSSFSKDVRLVYARHAGRGFLYNFLPFVMDTNDGQINLGEGFTNNSLVLTLTNSNGTTSISDAKAFTGYMYRYLSVPLAIYLNSNVDWTDYEQVATALNFPQ